jgi:hypothetical protein
MARDANFKRNTLQVHRWMYNVQSNAKGRMMSLEYLFDWKTVCNVNDLSQYESRNRLLDKRKSGRHQTVRNNSYLTVTMSDARWFPSQLPLTEKLFFTKAMQNSVWGLNEQTLESRLAKICCKHIVSIRCNEIRLCR